MSAAYVFVSYSRKQYYVAEQIAASLSSNGLPAWLDVQEIPPGADWQTAIDQGIANCAALVLVASQSAYRSAAVQKEVAAAQAAGKPIYLAVIQDCRFVKQLRDTASIVDCRFAFEQQITTLAQAILAGRRHRESVHGWRPLGDTMPFGRAKYLQLLVVALSYTVGTIVLLLNKQVIVYRALPQQLLPLIVLITAPVSAWLISLLYSWYLVYAFRQQRPVSFTALEIWPTINLVLIPVLFFFLDLGFLIRANGVPQTISPGEYPGAFLPYYFTIDERLGASSLVFSALTLVPYGFLLLSELRRSLILFFAALAFLVPAALPLPMLLKLSVFGLLACVLLAILLWSFFRGSAVQDAFDGNNSLPVSMRGFVIAFGLAAFVLAPIWFLPIYLTFRVLLMIIIPVVALRLYLQGTLPFRRRARGTSDRAEVQASRQWAKWLIPGAFNTDQFHSISATAWQRITPGAVPTAVAWSVLSTPADAAVAREIRQVFAGYPTLRETDPQQARYHLLVLSNTTPRRWIAEQEARFPRSVCVITAPVNITALGVSLQQNQFVDYRLRHVAALRYLAQALAGDQNYVNPILPEDFHHARGPYPLRLVSLGLRLLGALNLIVGAASLGVLRLAAAPALSYPLAALALALGAWCFWEAERLPMRRTTLATLLLSLAAGIASLCYWVFSGALSALAPRGLLVRNSDIDGRVSVSMAIIFVLVAAPVAVFVTAALVELARKASTLRRWLPGITWRVWRRTLGVATIRNINLSYGVYALGALLSATLLFTDSPLHFPRFHEYDLPDAGLHARRLAVAPNGDVWFEDANSSGDAYNIGYITPSGDLRPRYYSIPQPKGCYPLDCVSGASFSLGPDGSVWFASAQGGSNRTAFIEKITTDGRLRRFPLPAHTSISGLHFTFDASGNLWYLRLTPLSLSLEKDAIGRIDAADHRDEFALPDNSSPAALAVGPDGAMWATLSGSGAIARVTPDGAMTMFTLPPGVKPGDLLVGPDHALWFTAPDSSAIGRMSVAGALTMLTLPAQTKPRGLVAGADGSLWYVDAYSDRAQARQETVGRIMTDDSVRTYHLAAFPASGSTLAAAPDGGVWLTLYNKIGHIARDGSVTLYDTPTLDADLGEAILADDHHLWFTEYTGVIGVFAV